jgi:hypothetical protein
MSVKSWVGVVMALAVFGLFGLYISKHEITAVAGFCFGGGLLFAGMLIDPAEFKDLLPLLPFRRSSE